jgi:hypothetical protein
MPDGNKLLPNVTFDPRNNPVEEESTEGDLLVSYSTLSRKLVMTS